MKITVTQETTVHEQNGCRYIREEDGKEKVADLMVTTYTADTDLLKPKQFFLRRGHIQWDYLHSMNFPKVLAEWTKELVAELELPHGDRYKLATVDFTWKIKGGEEGLGATSSLVLHTDDVSEGIVETPIHAERNIGVVIKLWVEPNEESPNIFLINGHLKQLIQGQNELNADGFPCYVWDVIWPHGIDKIYHMYSDHVHRILYIPNPKNDNSITNVEDVSKVPTPKKISYDVCMFNGIYPHGHEKTMDGKTYQFPAGSYFRLDETKLPAMSYEFCHNNQVLTIDGVKMNNVTFDDTGWIKDGTTPMSNIQKFGRGFYRFMGYLAEDLLELGYKSSVEYSNIQDHITSTKTVTCKKDTTTGQFLFIGEGNAKIKWDTKENIFKQGDIIYINQDVEISSGDGNSFDAYEFYQIKDKSSLYG